MSSQSSPAPVTGAAAGALRWAGILWFLVAAIGQAAFVGFILAFYGTRTAAGNYAGWNDKPLIDGYVAGDAAGNFIFAAHVLLAAIHAHLRAHLHRERLVRRAQRDRGHAVAEEVVEAVAFGRCRIDAQAQALHLLHAGEVARRDAHEVVRLGHDALVLVSQPQADVVAHHEK